MEDDETSSAVMMNVSSLLLTFAAQPQGADSSEAGGIGGVLRAVVGSGGAGLNRSAAGLSNSTRKDDVMNHPAVQFHIYALYAIIFVVGLLGNFLVVFVVANNKAMQTVTNVFIANLALSDILLCVLAVPFTPLYFYLDEWIFGKILCNLLVYSQGTSVYVSTLTLTSIAIDRFFVILYPFRPRMQMTTCWITILLIWLVALCATLPYGIFVDVTTVDNRTYCEEKWEDESDRQIFGAVTTVMQFVVPFIIMAFAYTKVSIKLADRSREKAKIRLKSCRGEEADRERSRRTNRMLIAMVTIFGASWLPLNLMNLLNDLYAETISWWKYFNLCFFLAHTIAMSSTCYNVFLYAWLNDNFRKELKRILPCFSSSADGVNIPVGRSITGHHNQGAGKNAVDGAAEKTAVPAAEKDGGSGESRGSKRSGFGGRLNGALVLINNGDERAPFKHEAQSSEFDDGPEMSTTCVQILLPGEEEEDDPNHQQQQKPLLLTDVATVEMAPDASSVRFRNGGRTSPVAGDQNNHSKDSSGGCGGTTNNVMAVTAELTLPPSSSYNHQQSNNGSHQLIDGDTCPQCCSPSAKTSFMTFEELADINNIVVAKSPN